MACTRRWEFKGQRGRLVVKCKLMKFSMSGHLPKFKEKNKCDAIKVEVAVATDRIPWRRKLLNQLICPCEQMWLGSPPPLGSWRLVILGAWRVGLLEEAIKCRWIIEHRALCLQQPQPASRTASHHSESWFFSFTSVHNDANSEYGLQTRTEAKRSKRMTLGRTGIS